MTPSVCGLSCAMHMQTAWMIDQGNTDWIRANLPAIRRIGRTLWRRNCTCDLASRVERIVKEGSRGNRA